MCIVSSYETNATAAPVTSSSLSTTASTTMTATPVQHLVVIFQENISYDHYFGLYPNATNPQGEPKFNAEPNTQIERASCRERV